MRFPNPFHPSKILLRLSLSAAREVTLEFKLIQLGWNLS